MRDVTFWIASSMTLLTTFSDVADVVTFLASDRSSYITGTSVEITGKA